MALVLAAILLTLSYAASAQHSAVDPEPRDNNWWQQRQAEKNAQVAEGNVDLLFIGDSITHGWEGKGKEVWEEYYAHRNAVNLGFSGDRTQHVLWRLQHGNIEDISPQTAVIMIGTNNWKDNSAPEIAEGVTAIIELLREKLPTMKILLLGIFPRADRAPQYQEKLEQANEQMAMLADWEYVHYLDIGYAFLDEEGEVPKSIMPDLLHPNELGYQLWAKAMEPVLANLLGDATVATDDSDWQTLFNGKSLEGWEVVGGDANGWAADDGLLYTTGEQGGGWLSTANTYADFELVLEFRVPEGGNSGVFIRAPHAGNPAFAGSEIQVLDDYADEYKNLKPWQFTGSVYATAAPEKRVTRPANEWQKMRVRAKGPEVTVWVNGRRVTTADLSAHEDKLEDHPGLARESGYIGLQNHGSRLDYRDLAIRTW
ncbi:MAG: family 16 glycoside hydrolase [Candidatus Hydrogenedentota bacterium]